MSPLSAVGGEITIEPVAQHEPVRTESSRCGACVKGCPTDALSLDESETFEMEERTFTAGKLDCGRGCIRACEDHLEKAGRLTKRYRTPLISGKRWRLPEND